MKAVIVEPWKVAREADIDGSLQSLQEIVGGFIELVHPFPRTKGVVLICDEEGLMKNKELNFVIGMDWFHGTVVFAGDDGSGELTGLSDHMAKRILKTINTSQRRMVVDEVEKICKIKEERRRSQEEENPQRSRKKVKA